MAVPHLVKIFFGKEKEAASLPTMALRFFGGVLNFAFLSTLINICILGYF